MIYGIMTAAAVLGIVFLLLSARAVFGRRTSIRTVTVVPLNGERKALERLIRALYWENKFREGSCCSIIAAVSCGDSENDAAAVRLAKELDGVHFMNTAQLLKYISEVDPGDRKDRKQ